jgi:excisionase family DNA binding protein
MTQMIDQQPLYDLPSAAALLGNVSRSTLYRLIAEKKIVRVNIGSKAVITGESLAKYIEELMNLADGDAQ